MKVQPSALWKLSNTAIKKKKHHTKKAQAKPKKQTKTTKQKKNLKVTNY